LICSNPSKGEGRPSFIEQKGPKLLGEAKTKGSSFLKKLEQRFKLLGEAKAKVQAS